MAMIIPMIASAAGAIGSGVATVGGAVAGAMGTAATAAGSMASAAASGLGSLASAAGSGLSTMGSAAASGLGQLGGAITSGIGKVGTMAGQGLTKAGSAMQQGLGSLGNYASQGISKVGSSLSEGLGSLKSAFTGGSNPLDKMPATQNILSGQGATPSVDMFDPSTWTNNAIQGQDMGINLSSTGDPSSVLTGGGLQDVSSLDDVLSGFDQADTFGNTSPNDYWSRADLNKYSGGDYSLGMGDLWDVAKSGASSAWDWAEKNPELALGLGTSAVSYGDQLINRHREKKARKRARKRAGRYSYKGTPSWEQEEHRDRHMRIG